MEHSSLIGRWTIRFDPDLTRQLYAQTPVIACVCADCANWRAAGETAFSPPFLALLLELGIHPGKPAELCHYGDSGQPMPTQGWFHFAGRLEGGADCWHDVNATTQALNLDPFPGIKGVGFTTRLSQVPSSFAGHPLVQLEFATIVPWVTAVPLA